MTLRNKSLLVIGAGLLLVAGCGATPIPNPSPVATIPIESQSTSSVAPSPSPMSWTLVAASDLDFPDGIISELLVYRDMAIAAGGASLDEGAAGRIWVSRDAEEWDSTDMGAEGDRAAVAAVRARDDLLIAVGTACCPQSAAAWTSTGAETWQLIQQLSFAGGSMWALATSGAEILGMGCSPADTCGETTLWKTQDGLTWNKVAATGLADADLMGLASNGSRVVGVGTKDRYASGPPVIVSSEDGATWVGAAQPFAEGTLIGVATTANGGFLAVGSRTDTTDESGTGVLLQSADGLQWQLVESPSFANASFADIAVKGQTMMIVGTSSGPNDDYPGAWISLDAGATWQNAGSPDLTAVAGELNAVAVLPDGRFLVGGDQQTADIGQPAIWVGNLIP